MNSLLLTKSARKIVLFLHLLKAEGGQPKVSANIFSTTNLARLYTLECEVRPKFTITGDQIISTKKGTMMNL